MLSKVVKYVRKLVQKKQDPTLMTKEEFFARVDESLEQARQGRVYEKFPNETFSEFRQRIGR